MSSFFLFSIKISPYIQFSEINNYDPGVISGKKKKIGMLINFSNFYWILILLQETIYKNFKSIEFFPQHFTQYLLSSEVGFAKSEVMGCPTHHSKGFQRPIFVFTKSNLSPLYSQRSATSTPSYTLISGTIPNRVYTNLQSPAFTETSSSQAKKVEDVQTKTSNTSEQSKCEEASTKNLETKSESQSEKVQSENITNTEEVTTQVETKSDLNSQIHIENNPEIQTENTETKSNSSKMDVEELQPKKTTVDDRRSEKGESSTETVAQKYKSDENEACNLKIISSDICTNQSTDSKTVDEYT